MSISTKEHWNAVYSSNPEKQLGWYEAEPQVSLELIENCSLDKHDPILDIGSGATTLIDHLLLQNYTNLTALDISEIAFEKLRTRLGTENASRVQMLVDDITAPAPVLALQDIALWHDRALLHFLIDDKEQQTYLAVLKKVLRPRGYVIIAAFAENGAKKCSGLDVKRYDDTSLAAFLGEEFELVESSEYLYHMPSGDMRPYIYVRFQRKISCVVMTEKNYSFIQASLQKIGSSTPGSWIFSKIQPHIDRVLFRLTNGKTNLTSILSGLPVVLLTSMGAKSGLPRTTPLLGIRDQSGTNKIALIASNYGQRHHPAWYYNLKANPQVTCSIDGKARNYISYQAEGEEYAGFWQAAMELYLGFSQYQERAGDRHIPIMVLTPIEE